MQEHLDLGVLLGNGKHIEFWAIKWIEGVILRENFPTVFALSMKKKGKVCEFRYQENERWVWEIELRRQPLGQEEEQWKAFISVINKFQLSKEFKDELV